MVPYTNNRSIWSTNWRDQTVPTSVPWIMSRRALLDTNYRETGMVRPESSVIELQVEKVGQLFDTLDPTPFRERDLDREAEEYIVGWARELPRKTTIRIIIHMPVSEVTKEQTQLLGQAVNRYFGYRADMLTTELKEVLRVGRYSLCIGLVVLTACVISARLIAQLSSSGEFTALLREGLIILGWVANWRPIEIILYDRWPIIRRRNLYRRLAGAEITVSPR